MNNIEYNIEGNYGYGWEMVMCEDNFLDARQRIKEYKENEPNISFRINRIRIKEETK